MTLLEVIARQAAILLENTRLYTELQERELRIRRLVDSNIIGVIFWEMGGRITEANDAFLSLVGYSRQDLLSGNVNWMQLTPPEYGDADAAANRELQETGTHVPYEKEYVRKDGRRIPVLLGGAFLHGSQDYGVSFVLDLSERRRTEAERQAHQVAEAANRAKSEFLATMSHELRTPLNGMLGYTQILGRDPSLNERQHWAVDVIQRSGQQLLRLISDILDLAKVESGRLELTPVEIQLPEFLESVTDVIRLNAAERGLTLTCDWDSSLPSRIRADEDCLRRVLLNLLSNAVKFTDRGEVRLQVRFTLPTRLRFEVQDTGIGIRKEFLDSLFQPFCQVGEATRRMGGTGLGLAISQQLVRGMGGELCVESVFGTGSRFWFELDRVALPPEQPAGSVQARRAVTGYQGPRRTILIADDVNDNRAMLVDWLRPLGFETLEAVNGLEALQKAALRPDLILMDLVMPELDGLEALRRLRERPDSRALPVIATSASASPGDARRSYAAGAEAFVAKPIDLSQLQNLLGSMLSLTWSFAPAPGNTQAAAAQVLIVPPPPEIEVLYGLAQQGSMRDIERRAAYVASLDARYEPFARELQRLARAYRSKEIVSFIRQYRH